MAFEAEIKPVRYLRLDWKGMVRNGKLDVISTTLRQGEPTVENRVMAASRR